jgi:hemerythrin
MPIIVWNDTLSVQVAEIDRQHQKLVDMINGLHEAMLGGKSKDVLGTLVAELAGYATTHFGTEEAYFQKFGYPQAAAHKKEHAGFVKKVSDFQSDFAQGRLMLSMDVMNFLKDWLVNHIQGTDQKYSAFFHAQGLR